MPKRELIRDQSYRGWVHNDEEDAVVGSQSKKLRPHVYHNCETEQGEQVVEQGEQVVEQG